MPEIAIYDLDTDAGRLRTGVELVSVAVWPDAPELRREYCVAFSAALTASNETFWTQEFSWPPPDWFPRHPDKVAAFLALLDQLESHAEGLGGWFREAGGLGALAQARSLDTLGREIRKRERDMLTARRLVRFMWSITLHHPELEPSVRKAKWLLERSNVYAHRTPTSISSAWARYKGVAHIGAAWAECGRPWTNPGPVLARAKAYLTFTEQWVERRTGFPLVRPDTLWSIPDAAGRWEDDQYLPPPLPEQAVRLLTADYRAPLQLDAKPR